jgi:N-acetylneuraminate synthase
MSERTLVIAEAGVNHNGSLDMALQLLDAAADAGADVVKFQTFRATRLATSSAARAQYQVANTGEHGSQVAMLRSLELSEEDHGVLFARARQRDIRFMSTAFDAESLAFLARLGVTALKIGSGDLTCAPLLLQAARLRMPLILSTGMSTLGEIEQALAVIAYGMTVERQPAAREDFAAALHSREGRQALEDRVTLLHCVTEYPAPAASVHLRAMDTLAAAFGLPVGYSDHTLGTEVSIAAVARGARVIEKHFTLDRALPGPDHPASLEPGELAALVRAIRNVELALGSPLKQPSSQELSNRVAARRSLVASRAIRKGEEFTIDMLDAKRPGGGLSPMQAWNVVGTKAGRDYEPDEPIES